MSEQRKLESLEILEAVARPAQLASLVDEGALTTTQLLPVFSQDFGKDKKTPLLAQAVYRASIIGGFHDKDLARGYLRPLVAEIVRGLSEELTSHQLLNTIYIAPELLTLKGHDYSKLFASIEKPQMHWLWANPDAYTVISRHLDEYIDAILISTERPPNFLALCVAYVSARMAREPRPVLDKEWRPRLVARLHELGGDESVQLLGPSYFAGPRAKMLTAAPPARRKKLRIAICLTGQLRGFERAVGSWAELLQPDADYEFFLSTWACSGAKSFSWQHLNRFVDREASTALIEFRDRVGIETATQACTEFFTAKRASVNVEKMAGLLKRYGPLTSYSLVDEDDPLAASLTNPEKMYFHNGNALGLVRERLNDFDLVVKIRPDMLVGYRRMTNFWTHIARECATKSIVYAETGFRYEEWGFGCGDQIGIGTPADMRVYMSAWDDKDYHLFQTTSVRGAGTPVFVGHVSLGAQLLRRGIDVIAAPLEFRGLSSDPVLTKRDIEVLLDRPCKTPEARMNPDSAVTPSL